MERGLAAAAIEVHWTTGLARRYDGDNVSCDGALSRARDLS